MADRMNRPKQVDLNFVASELQLEPSLVGRRRRKKLDLIHSSFQ